LKKTTQKFRIGWFFSQLATYLQGKRFLLF
jgi:hypothetical protein